MDGSPTSDPLGAQDAIEVAPAAGLDQRAMAHLVDLAVPAALIAVLTLVATRHTSWGPSVLVLGLALAAAWLVVVCSGEARDQAGPGMRVMGLQVVDAETGGPLGWRRSLARIVVLLALEASVLGWVAMVIGLLRQPRRRGWHDRLVGAVVQQRVPAAGRPAAAEPRRGESEQRATPPPARPERPATARPGWVVTLDDDREFEVSGLLLVGRDPDEQPLKSVQLVVVPDATNNVSRTHLLLGVDEDGVYISDQGSAHGTTVTTPAQTSTPCLPGVRVRVGENSVVSFGGHWLRANRDARPSQSAA